MALHCPDCWEHARIIELNIFKCCETCGYNQEEAVLIDGCHAAVGADRETIRSLLEHLNVIPLPFYKESKGDKGTKEPGGDCGSESQVREQFG